MDDAAANDPLIGQTLGSYRLQRRLGEGGMGIVYEAVHTSLSQHVAIKVLRQNFSSDEKTLQRFFNEARAVGIIQHPGLVRIHDYQHTPGGNAYIVMEYLQGQPLDARLEAAAKENRGLPLAQTLQLGSQVAAGLAAAHAAAVVHCDLKPENIFLCRDESAVGGERAKILDFGIAKFLADSSGKKTTVGLVLGTPRYMAPEQCEGRDAVTAKVDVYALGAILYEMVAGTPPFTAQSASGLMRQHMMREPPPLRDKAPTCPLSLHTLVLEMLAKEPAARPTMAQVLARIQQIEPVEASGPGDVKAAATKRLLLLSLGVVLLAGVSGGIYLLKRRPPSGASGLVAAPSTLPTATRVPTPTPAAPAAPTPPTPSPQPSEGPERHEHPLKADAAHKGKGGKAAPKEGHPLAAKPAATGGTTAAVASPPVESPSPAAKPVPPPAPKKISNQDIEPDR